MKKESIIWNGTEYKDQKHLAHVLAWSVAIGVAIFIVFTLILLT